jgi:hypothetical protein
LLRALLIGTVPFVTDTVLAYAGIAVGVLGLLVAVFALIRANRAMYGAPGQLVDDEEAELARLRSELDGVLVGLSETLRHIAVVRYDVADELDVAGSTHSWSLALLDDAGDGVVLTLLPGRGDQKTYAKNIRGGECDIDLTEEERQAVDYARGVAHGR